MARHVSRTSILFGVIFVLTMIISQRYHLSFAQQCEVTCTQTAVIRERTYSDCLEVAQNREWELEDDFGGDLPGFLRNYKLLYIKRVLGVLHLRSKRSPQNQRLYIDVAQNGVAGPGAGPMGPIVTVMDLGR